MSDLNRCASLTCTVVLLIDKTISCQAMFVSVCALSKAAASHQDQRVEAPLSTSDNGLQKAQTLDVTFLLFGIELRSLRNESVPFEDTSVPFSVRSMFLSSSRRPRHPATPGWEVGESAVGSVRSCFARPPTADVTSGSAAALLGRYSVAPRCTDSRPEANYLKLGEPHQQLGKSC